MSSVQRGTVPTGLAADGRLSPGEHLRAEIERLGLDQIEVSNATGVSRQSINNIINGRQPISRAMAGKLGRLTGRSSDYWLRSSFAARGAPSRDSDAEDQESLPPRGGGVLVNHQIIRAIKDGVIAIDPFSEDNVQLASIDLTLDDFVVTADGRSVDITDGQGFALRGGEAAVVCTRETVEFPRDYIGRVGAMSTHARRGIMTSHGFQIDPGFKGALSFCIFNAGGAEFALRSGAPIISLEIVSLNTTPTPDERAIQHLKDAGDRSKVVSIYRGDACDRLIRDAIRDRIKTEPRGEQFEARIPELNVALEAASADVARDTVTQSVLDGLRTLRETPHHARETSKKFAAFFDEIADHLHLNGEQARQAVNRVGVAATESSTPIATLRDGKQVMLHLPAKSALISLKRLASQMHEDPADLILALTGLLR